MHSPNSTVAAEVTRRTFGLSQNPPPHVGGYALTSFPSLFRGLKGSLVVCTALALLTPTAFAQTWQTGDDFQYVQGADNSGLTVAPSGVVLLPVLARPTPAIAD